jgi:hypothetical protein
MTPEHEQWITQAVELARRKQFDQARELAVKVVREDGRNTRALWIVASTTASLSERRNALNALLRLQPDNLHAHQMLNSIEQDAKKINMTNNSNTSSKSSTAIRSIKPDSTSQHLLLYAAVAIAALVIVATVVIAAQIV